MHLCRWTHLSALALVPCLFAHYLVGQDFFPLTANSLQSAITISNTNGEPDTINLGGNTILFGDLDALPYLPDATPPVTGDLNATTLINGVIARAPTSVTSFRLLHVGAGGNLVLSNLTVRNGSSPAFLGGGGILVDSGGQLSMSNSRFESNIAGGAGGAISNLGVIAQIVGTSFVNNTATGSGGAIALFAGSLISLIDDSVFAINTAFLDGGAIYMANGTITIVSDSVFNGNSATLTGGAVQLDDGMLGTVQNTTFSANDANTAGGIGVSNADIRSFVSNTVVLNSATSDAGGIALFFPPPFSFTASFQSNLVALNISPITPDMSAQVGSIGAEANNFIGNNLNSTFVAGTPNSNGSFVGNPLAVLNPNIAPLANNGGTTQTHALQAGSLAIDNGSNILALQFDQRESGFLRVSGAQADIGAFEVQVCSVDSDSDGVCEESDNCSQVPNPTQSDGDSDTVGDSCDNCLMAINASQVDSDSDGSGDACDSCPMDRFDDADGDTICGNLDNCQFVANATQTDSDMDGSGNACDECPMDNPNTDADGDGVCDAADQCPGSSDSIDSDNDSVPDDCDNCQSTANANQRDTDGDGEGDVCDGCRDTDGDGIGDPGFLNTACKDPGPDNCPYIANPSQDDHDKDDIGDKCDTIPLGAEPIAMPPRPPRTLPVGVGAGPELPAVLDVIGDGPEIANVDSSAEGQNMKVTSAKEAESSEEAEQDLASVVEEEQRQERGGACSSVNGVDSSLALLLIGAFFWLRRLTITK